MKKLSSLTRCPPYSVHFIEVFYENLLGKRPEPKVIVRLSQVSALEHVLYRHVSLYAKLKSVFSIKL